MQWEGFLSHKNVFLHIWISFAIIYNYFHFIIFFNFSKWNNCTFLKLNNYITKLWCKRLCNKWPLYNYPRIMKLALNMYYNVFDKLQQYGMIWYNSFCCTHICCVHCKAITSRPKFTKRSFSHFWFHVEWRWGNWSYSLLVIPILLETVSLCEGDVSPTSGARDFFYFARLWFEVIKKLKVEF